MAGANIAEWLMSQARGSAGGVLNGTVAETFPSEYRCRVALGGTIIDAYYGDQIVDWMDVGASVLLIPVGDTYMVVATRGGAGGGGVGASYGPELLANPSFEYGPGGAWNGPTSWTIEWNFSTGEPLPYVWDTSPGDALEGSASVSAALVAGDWTHAMNVIPAAPVTVDPGSTYRASVWVKADDNTQDLTVSLRTYTASKAANVGALGVGVDIVTHATVLNPGAAYQLLTGSFTVPSGHKFARVSLRTSAPTGAAVVAHWDSASLRQQITS